MLVTSTLQGEAKHQRVKRRYKRASKSNYTQGIAKLTHREQVLRKIAERQKLRDAVEDSDAGSQSDAEALPRTTPEVHHHMSLETKYKLTLSTWLKKYKKDPACKVSPKTTMVGLPCNMGFRISFPSSKTISLLDFKAWNTRAMSANTQQPREIKSPLLAT